MVKPRYLAAEAAGAEHAILLHKQSRDRLNPKRRLPPDPGSRLRPNRSLPAKPRNWEETHDVSTVIRHHAAVRQTGSRRRRALPTRPVMTYATYIGRVGALALGGVGAAVATGYGVAWAEPSGHLLGFAGQVRRLLLIVGTYATDRVRTEHLGRGIGYLGRQLRRGVSPPSIAGTGTAPQQDQPARWCSDPVPSGAMGLNKRTVAADTAQRRCARRGIARKPTLTPPANDVLSDVRQHLATASGRTRHREPTPSGTVPSRPSVVQARLVHLSRRHPSLRPPRPMPWDPTMPTQTAPKATVIRMVAAASTAIAQPSTAAVTPSAASADREDCRRCRPPPWRHKSLRPDSVARWRR